MPTLRVRAEIEPLALAPYLAAVPAFLARWRRLDFTDGVVHHPRTGEARHGLRVGRGRHPDPGTEYLLLDDSQAGVRRPRGTAGRRDAAKSGGFRVTVLNDEPAHAAIAVRDSRHTFDLRLGIDRPDQPGPLRVSLHLPDPFGGGWWTRGPVAAEASLALDELIAGEDSRPQLVASVAHPRLRGDAEILIAAPAGDRPRWLVAATLRVSGRGLLRAPVGVGGPIVRRLIRRHVDEFLAGLPGQVAELNESLAAGVGPDGDPQTLAGRILDELISAVPAIDDGRRDDDGVDGRRS